MDLLVFKIAAAVAIFLFGLGGGLLPRRLALGPHARSVMSLGNIFAGGVFLGAALIHVLPDAQAGFAEAYPHIDYPLFGLICGLSVGLMLLIEKVGESLAPDGAGGEATYPALLMVILSIHSVITGIALGIENLHTQALVLLLAVLAHKGTAAFALGAAMLGDGSRRVALVPRIVTFSLTTPLGILLGSLMAEAFAGGGEVRFEAVFDAMAAGTFLFVSIFEILYREFRVTTRLPARLAALLLGYLLMALVAVWT